MKTEKTKKTLGVVGGGQLGMLLIKAANSIDVKCNFIESSNSCPARQVSDSQIEDEISSPDAYERLAAISDFVTIEIEHVDANALEKLGKPVFPNPKTIKIIQDKYQQKLFLKQLGIPCYEFHNFSTAPTIEDFEAVSKLVGFPFLLKSKTLAYDGRGNMIVSSSSDFKSALNFFKSPVYIEKFVPFDKELAIIVARDCSGNIVSYPTVETIQVNNACHVTITPAAITQEIDKKVRDFAHEIIRGFNGVGVFGIEFFLVGDQIYVNEVAPRVHNSGHYTINACDISQFDLHVRCCVGVPIVSPKLLSPCAMINLIPVTDSGTEIFDALDFVYNNGGSVCMYGKEFRKGRKIGHVNITGELSGIAERVQKIQELLLTPPQYIEKVSKLLKTPLVSILMGSDSDLQVLNPLIELLKSCSVPFEYTVVSAHRTPQRMFDFASNLQIRGVKVVICCAGGAAHLPGMVAALTSLPVIGIPRSLSCLDGMDSLLSIVQMPKGVPVATVAINGSYNAGILALRILGSSIEKYNQIVMDLMKKSETEVLGKALNMDKCQ